MPHGSIQQPYVNNVTVPVTDHSTTNIDITSTSHDISLRDNHDDAPDVKTTGNPNVDAGCVVPDGQRGKHPQEDFQPFSDTPVLGSQARKATKTNFPGQTVPSAPGPGPGAEREEVTQSGTPDERR